MAFLEEVEADSKSIDHLHLHAAQYSLSTPASDEMDHAVSTARGYGSTISIRKCTSHAPTASLVIVPPFTGFLVACIAILPPS